MVATSRPPIHGTVFATVCGHTMHPSAPLHTPRCIACEVSWARACAYDAAITLASEGGRRPVGYRKSVKWRNAIISYEIARRRLKQTLTRAQLQWEREMTWDYQHETFARNQADKDAVCTACTYRKMSQVEYGSTATDRSMAWWERPGALAASPGPSTPPRAGGRVVRRPKSTSSPKLHYLVSILRATRGAQKAQEELDLRRRTTEAAVRRKHKLGPERVFDVEVWDSPVNALSSRASFQCAVVKKRADKRRARGGRLRPSPGPSPLSQSRSVSEITFGEQLQAGYMIQEKEHEREQQQLEKELEVVEEQMRFLYLVGQAN